MLRWLTIGLHLVGLISGPVLYNLVCSTKMLEMGLGMKLFMGGGGGGGCVVCTMGYRRSGNFRVKKLSYDKFSCKFFFVGTTPFCISVNSAC